MHSLLLTALALLPAQPADTIFDLKALLAPPLEARTLKRTEKDGIVTEEVMFHSETDAGKRVDIFAYLSYPLGAKKLPAFIWNQGGLYRATTYWTEFGAKRGYATLCIDFPLPGYRSTGSYPITSSLELTDDPRQAPIYHGAVALLRAVSYLQTRAEVDAERIGMAGSSWGGFYTTLMIGIDPRLKAGSCMFGCGGLQLGNSWWDGSGWNEKRDPAFRERWRSTLDPAWRLRNTKTPIAWFTGTNDQFYWMPALMQTYESAAGPKLLGLLPNWNHALTEALDEQVFVWLDSHLKDARPLTQVTALEIVGESARWRFEGSRKIARAELLFSPGDAGYWQCRHWQTLPAAISLNTCTAALPAVHVPGFISGTVVDADGFRTSTTLKKLEPVAKKNKVLDYDGCSEWGDFEAGQIEICSRHGWPVPALAKNATTGKQCAVLKAKWSSPPVLATAGVAHRLRCHVRGDKAATITVTLAGRFDGKQIAAETKASVGADWQEIALAFTPPRALTARMHLTIAAPPGVEVQLDNVTFRPVAGALDASNKSR